MSQKNREERMKKVWDRRGRTPHISLYKQYLIPTERKSRAGIVYIHYKKIEDIIQTKIDDGTRNKNTEPKTNAKRGLRKTK